MSKNDLDARVAALPKRYEELQKSGVETDTDPKSLIIKALQDKIAELQKPALHEPVSDQETIDAIHTHCFIVTSESMKDMRRTLESFLQGRVKPAQEEITNDDLLALGCATEAIQKMYDLGEWGDCCSSYIASIKKIVAAIRASKGEKT